MRRCTTVRSFSSIPLYKPLNSKSFIIKRNYSTSNTPPTPSKQQETAIPDLTNPTSNTSTTSPHQLEKDLEPFTKEAIATESPKTETETEPETPKTETETTTETATETTTEINDVHEWKVEDFAGTTVEQQYSDILGITWGKSRGDAVRGGLSEERRGYNN